MKIYPRVKPINFAGDEVSYLAHLMRQAKNQIALGAESQLEGKETQLNACLYSVELVMWEVERTFTDKACNFIQRSLLAHCARVQRFHSGARLP